ncbi:MULTISPECIES: hypothetical protein [unclassified Pseudomonas]|uniref:hypothetical protein n=1 Tax=unclassified Pseudomonas TaxID=196821 RepID=UPI001EFE7C59|nr:MULTISPECIES: hypothetical protein [unclassified Pseudomonas]
MRQAVILAFGAQEPVLENGVDLAYRLEKGQAPVDLLLLGNLGNLLLIKAQLEIETLECVHEYSIRSQVILRRRKKHR